MKLESARVGVGESIKPHWELNSVLCDNLEGWDIGILVVDLCCCIEETNTTL